MSPGSVGPRRPWLLFGGFSLAAVLVGCWVAAAHGAPSRAWITNLAAWALGAGLAPAIARWGRRIQPAWLVIAVAGLAATFLGHGLTGVHRWLGLGPMRLNGAELLLAPAVAALARQNSRPLLGLILPLTGMILLALQPDASQALAFGGACVLMLLVGKHPLARRLLTAALFAGLAAIACLRPDPLEPVPEVEGILRLAAAMSPLAAGAAMLMLAGAVLAPLSAAKPSCAEPAWAAACGLSAYLGLNALAPAIGAFPVPLIGMGVSPILGAWLGFGVLMSVVACEGRGGDRR